MLQRNLITVVCVANYCRSPVAEVILKNKYQARFEIISAGISPMPEPNMDQRSLKYLKDYQYDFAFHNPRKLSKRIIMSSSLVLAMDHYVLEYLNRNYKNYVQKFKMINFQHPNISTKDPYKYNDEDYNEVMNNIKKICEEIDI